MSTEPVLSAGDVERLVLDTFTKRPRSMSGPALPASQERPSFDFKLLVDPPLPSATITDLCNEPLFSGYLSDEEDVSSDDMSFYSSSVGGDLADDFETNFPELLAEDCSFVEQQCNKAQAITLVSPGKAKMIRVSKVDIVSSPLAKRSSSSTSRNHTQPSRRMSIVSIKAHSHDGSMSSGSPRIPSTPPLEQGSQTPSSSGQPATPETPDSLFDPLSKPVHNINSTPTPKPRIRNPYRLRLHSTKRAGSVQSIEAPLSAPLTAPSYKQPLQARAAGDRAPFLEMPAFTREQLPEPPKSARPWILRKDTFGPLGLDKSSNKLRRAESGVLPSWR